MFALLLAGGGPALAALASFQSEGIMEKYGTVKQCPKCGEKRFSDGIVYGPYGAHVVSGEGKERFAKKFIESRDMMIITCSGCGYQFNEFPLDYGGE